MKQVQLVTFQEVNAKLPIDDVYVKLTVCDIPSVLIKRFVEKIVQPHYHEDISEALKDLMWRAVQSEESI